MSTERRSIPFVDLRAQMSSIQDEVRSQLEGVLASCDFILGPDVARFESDFADYCETQHAVGVDSGMSALELALRACGVGPGDEVITVANTFIATALAISATGATPVLVDCDPGTGNIDPALTGLALTPRTRAVMPVHLYGRPADMPSILAVAAREDAFVVEDAAQAHGARLHGSRVGSFGHAAAFSFYPAKNLGALGDAGAVVTDDESIAATIRRLRDYGQTEKYQHDVIGFNRRLDTIQAAVLEIKLQHLDEWNDRRRALAKLYLDRLADVGEIGLPPRDEASAVESVWHLFVVQVDERDHLREFLADRGVSTGIHYPTPVHLQPAYASLGYERGRFPIAEARAARSVSLPMYPELPEEDVEYVASAIQNFMASRTRGA